MENLRKYLVPLGLWLLFEAIAVALWLGTGNPFYLANFSYIGTCLAAGIALYVRKWKHARRFVQFAVGLYMLGYLGIIDHENMQIEGFWYYLLLGVFEAAVIHYAVAKIAGPLVFGRGWCGYACWTAMVLDLLPYKRPHEERKPWGWVRYVLLVLSLLSVGALFVAQTPDLEDTMYAMFIAGNLAYYAVGIALAFALKDNRAFCKYLCPVAPVMKPASYFARLRVTCDHDKCVECGTCLRTCPMNVDMLDNARSRANGTECILCMECIDACPKGALKL